MESTKAKGQIVHWSSRIRPPASVGVAPPCSNDLNKRWSLRKTSEMPAFICSAKLQAAVRCVVRDTSSTGALIHLSPSAERLTVDDMPEVFTLVMTHYKARTEVECVVARRFGDGLGVRFTSAFITTSTTVRQPERRSTNG